MSREQPSTPLGEGSLGKLGSLKIVPVPPDHEHAPGELEAKFDLAAGIVYVREEDWPLIRAELAHLPTRQ